MVTRREIINVCADGSYDAGCLVAEDERLLGSPVTVEDM